MNDADLTLYRNARQRLQRRLFWLRQNPGLLGPDSIANLERRISALSAWIRDQESPSRQTQLAEVSFVDQSPEAPGAPRHESWVAARLRALAAPSVLKFYC